MSTDTYLSGADKVARDVGRDLGSQIVDLRDSVAEIYELHEDTVDVLYDARFFESVEDRARCVALAGQLERLITPLAVLIGSMNSNVVLFREIADKLVEDEQGND